MHKSHSTRQKHNVVSRNLKEKLEEHEKFQFPSKICRKKKKKKVTNRSGGAIQEERETIRKQGEFNYSKLF